ncbi:hypothetical protein Bca52824_050131 [Brassica carinata]|uniref:Uncharacterized protein n=1 Tax=Brassica carinata TaxID=52824 RepID=A0A8X7RMA4_BRACI|nr:hypothetical protein Bca52824_050131 [Brassica carinata]
MSNVRPWFRLASIARPTSQGSSDPPPPPQPRQTTRRPVVQTPPPPPPQERSPYHSPPSRHMSPPTPPKAKSPSPPPPPPRSSYTPPPPSPKEVQEALPPRKPTSPPSPAHSTRSVKSEPESFRKRHHRDHSLLTLSHLLSYIPNVKPLRKIFSRPRKQANSKNQIIITTTITIKATTPRRLHVSHFIPNPKT